MFRLICAIAAFVAPFSCWSGELLRDGTVVEVANSYGGNADFAIRVTGGTGVCATTLWIVFPESKAVSPNSYKQAISTALLAFSAKKKVRLHNFEDNSCYAANFISISD
ncbi:MAG: DUF5992 family protein [bacterium]|nr:DUF5992 family protein [bacterium]